MLAPLKARIADTDVPYNERQYYKNVIKRWVEFQNRGVIQHEAGHHIHFNIGLFPRYTSVQDPLAVPRWLVEGTTMLFECPPSTAGAGLGVLNHDRLHILRQMFGERPLDEDMWKAFLFNNMMWWTGPWGEYGSYQLGWSMVYYLYKERQEELGEYMRLTYGRDRGVDPTRTAKEFEDVFGPVSDWIEDYYAFLDDLTLRPSLTAPDLSKSYQQHLSEVRSGRGYGGGGKDRDRGSRGGSGKGKGKGKGRGRGKGG